MRRMIPAGLLMALALLIPAAPAAAQAAAPGLDAACKTVERKVYTDIRKLVTIDLGTATDGEILDVANKIMAAVTDQAFPVLAPALQERLEGTASDLRAFLEADLRGAWRTDLRISVGRTLTGAGTNVQAAAQKTLDTGSIDAYLAYLNGGLYAARELDCASQPSASPSVTPSATPSATATTTPSATPSTSPGTSEGDEIGEDGEGGGLPVTGSGTGTVAAVGGAFLLLGGAGYLIGRRRRSRFVA